MICWHILVFAQKFSYYACKICLFAAVGIGIWDTKFGVYHSWTPLSDSKQLHGQVLYTFFCYCKAAVWSGGIMVKVLDLWLKRSQVQISAVPLSGNSTHTHTQPFNGPLSRTTRMSRYQKGKTNLDFTEARDSEWQWHQLDHMQVCMSLQTDNHASTPPLSFLQARCPSCYPTNSVKALKANR